MVPGTVIARRFSIEGLAGQGGMGTVYRARDLADDGRPVAVKVLQEGSRGDAERFGREASALAELSHPGIVRYVSHGQTPDGRPFLAMEWLEGEDLLERLGRGPLAIAECVELGRRVGEALSVAHGRGIVHRDVKPSNLFLPGGKVDAVKLVDFGVVRLLGWNPGAATRPGLVVGTPGYMAPEQARGDDRIDARADVFALGCVLYECLTGQVAFPGEHVMAVLAKILFSELPPIREHRPDVPEAVDALVRAMLHKVPSQRPGDGAEVASLFGKLDPTGAVREDAPGAGEARVITGGALRLVSIVLAQGLARAPQAPAPPDDASTLKDLGASFAASGGIAQPLADGGFVIVWSGEGTAADLAEQAARCALDLATLSPKAGIAVATGLGDLSGHGVVGEAIDRGAQLLGDPREAPPRESSPLVRGPGSHGRIVIDEVTAGLLGPRFERDRDGALLRESTTLEDAPRTLLGRPVPCVGRKREMATLLGVVEASFAEPEPRVALITGAPGMGKSRLRQEVAQAVVERWPDARLWLGRGERSRRGSRLAIVASALRQMLRVRPGDALVLQRKVLAAGVTRLVPGDEGHRVAEFVGELVGVPFADESSVQLRAARADPRLMGDQLERAWLELLTGACERHPLVLVLEDLQWADGPTIRYVDLALRSLSRRPLCVLAFARPEIDSIAPHLWASRRLDRLPLPALGGKASAELVRAALGPQLPEADVTRIVDRSGGNALFLEQLVRAHAEGAGDAPPASVLAMLQARLDALPVEQRRVLRAASVFGRMFFREGVQSLLGALAPEPALGQWLGELADRELVTRSRGDRAPAGERWTFRHELQREAAYASLPDEERVLGHRLAAEWLEQNGPPDALAIAEHFALGGEMARAVGGYVAAAQAALQALDLDGTLAHAERAVACGATGETLGAIRAFEAEVFRNRGQWSRAMTSIREAVRLIPRGSTRWYLAVGQLAPIFSRSEENAVFPELGRELLVAPGPDSLGAWIVAATNTAIGLFFAGDYELGHALLAAIEARAAEVMEHAPSFTPWIHVARATRAQFDGDVAALAAEEWLAAQAHDAVGNRRGALLERGNTAYAYMLLGAHDRTVEVLRAVALESEKLGLTVILATALHNLGLALALQGEVEEGLAAEREAIRLHSTGPVGRTTSVCRLYASKIQLLAGRVPEALAEAEAALEAAPPRSPHVAQARAVLADAYLARGDAREALEQADAAYSILLRLGHLEEADAYVRLTFARALAAMGDRPAADAVLDEARRHVLAAAAKIGDPELRASFLERVPENAEVLRLASGASIPS